mgnify:CR=1 FL=1
MALNGSKPKEPEPPSLVELMATGDRREALEALRRKLADTIAEAPPHAMAALSGQLRGVVKELADMPGAGAGLPDGVLTIAAAKDRRAARRAGSTATPVTGTGG